jgi:predicted DNA-binding protein YlxM (UPF0122 family)
MMFEKNLQVAELLDTYGTLLGERVQYLLDLYYNQDCSLGEIAEEIGISRQGVRDSIKKAERELAFFESKLHLLARDERVRRASERALALCPEQGELRAAVEALVRAAETG